MKFKEKKTLLIEEVHVVLDSFTECTNIEYLNQDIIAGIVDKAPTVKKNVCAFLERITEKTYIDVLQRCHGDIM